MDLHNPDQTRDVVGSNQVLNPSVMKDTRGRAIRSCFTSLTLEMVSYARDTASVLSVPGLVPSVVLWQPYIRYACESIPLEILEVHANRTLSEALPMMEALASRFPHRAPD